MEVTYDGRLGRMPCEFNSSASGERLPGSAASFEAVSEEMVEKAREEIERFFQSEWFQTLTDMDGTPIMERLKKEV